MIITRNAGATKLNVVFAQKGDQFVLPKMISEHRKVDIIYFDKKINVVSMNGKIAPTMSTIGELERRDLPFILLADKKCDVHLDKAYAAVINVNCIPNDQLEDCFPNKEMTAKDGKSNMFNRMFSEFAEDYKTENFDNHFNWFVHVSQLDELLSSDALFLAMAAEHGRIHNANPHLGRIRDGGAVWHFNEEYDYDEEQIDMIEVVQGVSVLDEFKWMYEDNRSPFTMSKLKGLNVEQLTEVIEKYPNIFTDIYKRKVSYFIPPVAVMYEDMYEEPEDLQRIDDEEEYASPHTVEQCLEDYFEAEGGAHSIGTKLCFGCENYIMADQVFRTSVEGKLVDLCFDCDGTFSSR